jgi:programmed cell death protein 5
MDEELKKLRKKRLQELQQDEQLQQSMEEQQELQEKQFDEQKKRILRSVLTPQAKERLNNIKLARPQIGEQIENQLIMLAQSGRLQEKIDDAQLRQLLSKIIPRKRDIHIRRR